MGFVALSKAFLQAAALSFPFFLVTPQLIKAVPTGQMQHPRHAGLRRRGCDEAPAAQRDMAVMNGRDRKAEICRDNGGEGCSLSFKRGCLRPTHSPSPRRPPPSPSAAVAASFVLYLSAPLFFSFFFHLSFSSSVQFFLLFFSKFPHCHTITSATFPSCRFFISGA